MSASFYDLLKYAKTGIAAPDMTAYDKLKALSMCNAGFPVKTITGTPPISFQSDGTPLTAWSIYGNGQQQGTPTPDNPVMPEFVGARTANLFDESTIEVGGISQSTGEETEESSRRRSGFIPCTPSTTYTIRRPRKTTTSYLWVLKYKSDKTYIGVVTSVGESATFTTGTETAYLRWYTTQAYDYTNIMLNTGSTAQPYEPFGYKIPLTCSGQTVPVYLGQTQTVRRIKKLVMTGEENWSRHTDTGTLVLAVSGSDAAYLISGEVTCTCTHYPAQNNVSSYSQMVDKKICMRANSSNIWIRDTDYSTTTDFKTYLQQQYAAGTPVTVWYVLAAPETGIVNEPLCKIGDYADELSSTDAAVTIPTAKGQNTLTVDTELQPSEISITGGIK